MHIKNKPRFVFDLILVIPIIYLISHSIYFSFLNGVYNHTDGHLITFESNVATVNTIITSESYNITFNTETMVINDMFKVDIWYSDCYFTQCDITPDTNDNIYCDILATFFNDHKPIILYEDYYNLGPLWFNVFCSITFTILLGIIITSLFRNICNKNHQYDKLPQYNEIDNTILMEDIKG